MLHSSANQFNSISTAPQEQVRHISNDAADCYVVRYLVDWFPFPICKSSFCLQQKSASHSWTQLHRVRFASPSSTVFVSPALAAMVDDCVPASSGAADGGASVSGLFVGFAVCSENFGEPAALLVLS